MELQESPDIDDLHEKLRLRRESRRKKILENAKSRLEKLSMRQGGDGDTDLASKRASFPLEQECEYSDPEVEPDIPEHLHRTPPSTFQQFEDVLKSFDNTQSYEHATQEKQETFLKYKLHVILAVTVAYIATLVINQSEGNTVFVIIPFSLVLISDLTIFHQQKQRNPMIDMLVIFGIRPQQIVYALNVFTNIQIVVTDLSIFIFYFGIATFFGNQFVHLADIK